MITLKTGSTDPRVHGKNLSRDWFVGFRHTCPDCLIRKPYQLRMGINYLRTIQERKEEGKAIARVLKGALEDGWNPHHDCIEDFLRKRIEQAPVPLDDYGMMPFNQALEFSLEKKKINLADKSYRCFGTAKRYAQAAAVKLGYFNLPIKDTKRRHVKELMDQICRDRQADYDRAGKGKKITGNFYNKYKGYLQCIFSELVEFDAMEYNPCDRIKNRPAIVTNIHRHASPQERQLIKSTLQLKCPRLFVYLAFEYGTGMRPGQILGVRICDIDWFNQCIVQHSDGKTRNAKHIPIPNSLLSLLKRLNLEECNPLHYLFSNAFRPGAERKKTDYATKTWKEIIKDGLGLSVSLYSFKGLGGDDKRDAGVSLQAVSSQYGHSKLSTTMIYTHSEKERMDKELREKSPGL